MIKKARAWNRGLTFARGEYVLFLSGDEIIFSDTVNVLCQIYSFKKADIISAVQYLEENSEGKLVIANIQDKKYLRHTDEQFKKLSAPQLFKSDDLYQKLMMLGMKIFNQLLGTKFFRRDFLEKNSIHFNENLETGFELHFIANAFMASKETMFIPNLFFVAPSK